MNCVHIPAEVFESEGYQGLSLGNRELLIRLYAMFGDCDTFTVELLDPEKYGQKESANMAKKMKEIIDSGMVKVERHGAGTKKRLLSFAISVVEAYQ